MSLLKKNAGDITNNIDHILILQERKKNIINYVQINKKKLKSLTYFILKNSEGMVEHTLFNRVQ